jgi:hypothetical protein
MHQSASCRRPSRRGPLRRGGARSCTTEACLEVSRSTPAVRAAERRSKRGMAVNRRPLQSVWLAVLRGSHASRLANALRNGGRSHVSRIADARLRMMWSLRVVGTDPPRRASVWRARLEEPNETVPTSECHRRPEGTGARTTVAAPPAAPLAVRLAGHSPSRPEPQRTPLV